MILSNSLKGRVVISVNGTADTHTIVSLANVHETILNARLTRIYFSGNVTIANSSATILTLSGTDHWSLDHSGAAIPFANTDSITLTAGAGASAVIVLDKNVTINANSANATGYIANP